MSRYLLDTHALIWWVDDDPRMSPKVRRLIASSERVFASDVSMWEATIETSRGKLALAPDVLTWFDRHIAANRFAALPIARSHIARVETLPHHHGDPFDRLLVCQAMAESLVVVTIDEAFRRYEIETVW